MARKFYYLRQFQEDEHLLSLCILPLLDLKQTPQDEDHPCDSATRQLALSILASSEGQELSVLWQNIER